MIEELKPDVVVTDLIVSPVINTNKAFLPCGRYTKEENELLDKILASRVKEAGEGTRQTCRFTSRRRL